MKILFAALALQDQNGGVDKKIQGQAAALRNLGHDVVRLCYQDGRFFWEGSDAPSPALPSATGALGVYMGLQKALRATANTTPFDLCYTRHIFATPFQIATLRQMKRRGICTIEEFPTYPYDAEFALFQSPVYRAAALCDKLCRKRYKNLLDLCVTYSRDQEIFGVPAISIENGISLAQIPFFPRRYTPKKQIRLVAVSAMTPAHGYERLLEGLAAYQKTESAPSFVLDMVGDGQCREEWQALAEKLGLTKQVHFHGQLLGAELDAVLAEADLGIATLGWYKKGLTDGSELKVREYMARGLPFVYASNERLFSPADGFCLQVPNDSTPLDMAAVAAFYDALCQQPDPSRQLRQFAETHYTWDVQMKKVTEACLALRKE